MFHEEKKGRGGAGGGPASIQAKDMCEICMKNRRSQQKGSLAMPILVRWKKRFQNSQLTACSEFGLRSLSVWFAKQNFMYCSVCASGISGERRYLGCPFLSSGMSISISSRPFWCRTFPTKSALYVIQKSAEVADCVNIMAAFAPEVLPKLAML